MRDVTDRTLLDPVPVPQSLWTLVRKLEERPEVLFAYWYGSSAEEGFDDGGLGREARDVDVAVYLDEEAVPPENQFDHVMDLWEKLSRYVPAELDLHALNGKPPAFRFAASGGKLVMVRDPERLAVFLERTWDEYFDFAPMARRYLEELARG